LKHREVRCPSSTCKEGSELLGIRQANGKISILPQPLPIDSTFIQRASHPEIKAEQRFRFTNKCIESGCAQWDQGRCGLSDRLMEFLNHIPTNESLPSCSIRPSCRWFLQSGADACRICPYVITHVTEQEIKGASI